MKIQEQSMEVAMIAKKTQIGNLKDKRTDCGTRYREISITVDPIVTLRQSVHYIILSFH